MELQSFIDGNWREPNKLRRIMFMGGKTYYCNIHFSQIYTFGIISIKIQKYIHSLFLLFLTSPHPQPLFWLLLCDTSRSFLKIIFYWLCHKSCPNFSPLPPSTLYPHSCQAIPLPLFMSMGHAYKFFGYLISYTVLYIPMAIL